MNVQGRHWSACRCLAKRIDWPWPPPRSLSLRCCSKQRWRRGETAQPQACRCPSLRSLSAAAAATAADGTDADATNTFSKSECAARTTSSRSSVSLSEVEKFSAMNREWWDPARNPLLAMNKTRMAYVWEQIHRHCLSEKEEPPSTTTKTITEPNSPPLKILDVGCGGGLACESLARMFRSSSKNDDDSGGAVGAAVAVVVVGIDPSPDLIDVARAHALLDESRTGCIRYHNVSAEQYAEQYWNQQQQQKQQEKEEETVKLPLHNKEKDEVQLEGPFDVICLLEVVEHVQDPALLDSILFSLVGLLKEGGLLFISTINRTWKSHLLTIVGAEYVMGYLPVGTHRFDLYKSPDEIQSTLSRHGLRQLDVTGMIPTSVPIPFPPTWLLPKTTTGPCAARPPLPLALLSGLLTSPSWDWKLDPTDTDVNWIGTYQKKQTSTSDASEERN